MAVHTPEAGCAALFPVTKGYTQADAGWIQKVFLSETLFQKRWRVSSQP
jgi:hypothetical protein